MPAADVFAGTADWSVDVGDTREWVWNLPRNRVHCVVTSPPYYGLRDYQTASWDGGDPACDHVPDTAHQKQGATSIRQGRANVEAQRNETTRRFCSKCGAFRVDDQIGLEQTPDEYVASLVDVFRGVRRALHPTGVLWLNLGDSYNNAGSSRNGEGLDGSRRGGATGADGECGYKKRDNRRAWADIGIKHKDLIGIPWRVAFALQADGWYLRQHMPWLKGSGGMPESADDRPCVQVESVFLLTKNPDYYFDMQAVRRRAATVPHVAGNKKVDSSRNDGDNMDSTWAGDGLRNWRVSDFWHESLGCVVSADDRLLAFDVPTVSYKAAHFATFPPRLVLPMILAGSSQHGCCPHCHAPWVRQVEKQRVATRPGDDTKTTGDSSVDGNRDPQRHVTKTRTVGWEPSCDCTNNTPVPAVVVDPFTGSGTTLMVARDRGRRAAGVELNPQYAAMARKRIESATPDLF